MKQICRKKQLQHFWAKCVDSVVLFSNSETFLAHLERCYGPEIRETYDINASKGKIESSLFLRYLNLCSLLIIACNFESNKKFRDDGIITIPSVIDFVAKSMEICGTVIQVLPAQWIVNSQGCKVTKFKGQSKERLHSRLFLWCILWFNVNTFIEDNDTHLLDMSIRSTITQCDQP